MGTSAATGATGTAVVVVGAGYVCLVAGAFDVPELAWVSGLPVDERGRLLVDETLRSVGDPTVLGAGDAVAVTGTGGAQLRMACSVALPMGGHAADVLLSALRGQPAAPFSNGYFEAPARESSHPGAYTWKTGRERHGPEGDTAPPVPSPASRSGRR